MGEHNRQIECLWCRSRHGRRFLCDPAAALLAASAQRGMSGDLPAVEFDTPLWTTPDPQADRLMGQLVVKAAAVELEGGVAHPGLMLTGMDVELRPLPQWIYVSDDASLRRSASLVHDMAELAIRQADKQNANRRG